MKKDTWEKVKELACELEPFKGDREVRRFKNVGPFKGKIKHKCSAMTSFKMFEWWTVGPPSINYEEFVQKIWMGSPIPYREYCDICLVNVHRRDISPSLGTYLQGYWWSVEFGQTMNPIIKKGIERIEKAIESI